MFFFFPPFTGYVLSSKVSQTPPNVIINNQNDSVKIYCQHNIPSYEIILWYRQTQDKEMTLMAFLNIKFPNYEQKFKHRVLLDGEANINQNNSITIGSLSGEDTAVYYCAARLHSGTIFQCVQQKPSPCYTCDHCLVLVLCQEKNTFPATCDVFINIII